ncbi:MAG: hypothetical protein GF399_05340 [Candidatus Coatesbacteria bacterium]|nr:hypothetical protein [Candidatus Coatesbacteria bacterium]
MSYNAVSSYVASKPTRFNMIRITMASPETIRSWSSGEVKKAETINYRTLRAEKDGLFCERIFGPTRDWECFCGKYKRVKNKGVICDRCGVEVTLSKVRRERMGHIELEVPVTHIWYVKGAPGRVSSMLNISVRDLERVLYYESYIVTDPGETPLNYKQLLSEEQYQKARADFGYDFEADMGAGVIRDMLAEIDLEDMVFDLRIELENATSKQARRQILKRLTIAESFRKSGNRPEWMVLEVIPVIPPELRPLVPLDGGRFATSDLNDLYRSVIHRNNRLRRLKELQAPAVILRNEKRMLQEAVDALFDNGRRGRAVRGSGNRPLKSLSHTVKGKMGRFRQNLLGKRVDYSGRSVIVVGPELKLHQCGIPKRMALELFRPFVIMRLEQSGIVHTVKSARKLLDQVSPEVWDILEEIIADHPVLLNRAPTLHRLGIQAFQPVLVEGEAIRIHPLVCTAFNADFDGDQMAVHVPLSHEAQLEARLLMLATHNILSPANGKALATPTKDMVLGCYYLSKPRLPEQRTAPGECPRFNDLDEVKLHLDAGRIELHDDLLLRREEHWRVADEVNFRVLREAVEDPDSKEKLEPGNLVDAARLRRLAAALGREPQLTASSWVYATAGLALFNTLVPPQMRWQSKLMKKGQITHLVGECFRNFGEDPTVQLLDNLKWAGFTFATTSGLTFGIDDVVVPQTKPEIIRRTEDKVDQVTAANRRGEITKGERYNRVIDAWTTATNTVAEEMLKEMRLDQDGYNPIFMMHDSGSRGSRQQIRQLAGMRGLMAKPQKKITGSIGEIIENPIIANFRDGLSVLEYFISTHGARKGLADTALKTADAGYLTRRLVDVAHDTIITKYDCRTIRGIDVEPLVEGDEVIEPLGERILGRVTLDDVHDPNNGEVLVHAGEMIDEQKAEIIDEAGVEEVKIRSVLTCEAEHGVCALCYGLNPATGKLVDIGEAVGVIAAQSIGEPGTQLTLRTFHIGGTASRIIQQTDAKAKRSGRAELHNLDIITDRDGRRLANSRNGRIVLYDRYGNELIKYDVPYGAEIKVEHNQKIKKGKALLSWDPYTSPILATMDGRVEFIDIEEGRTMTEELDESSERIQRVITEYKDKKLHPQIMVRGVRVDVDVIHQAYDVLADAERRRKYNEDTPLSYYEILGVKRWASTDRINNVYNELNEDDALTPQIETAYNILHDPEQRKAYDDEHPPNHFERLGLRREADDVAVREAFLKTLRTLNPDIESRRRQLEQAHELLSDENKRAEFDESDRSSLYAVLHIEREADPEDIEQAYRERMDYLDYKLEKVNEAHEVLSDPDSRRKYDGSLDEPSYYELLGVNREAGTRKIERNFRRLTGDDDKPDKRLVEARDVLTDPQKRSAYDKKNPPNYYEILEVPRNATQGDIKLAFDKLANKFEGREEVYSVPIGAYILAHHGDEVKAGDVLAKIALESGKTSDITGGLPRVVELLEARKPKNPATISEIDGRVAFGQPKKGKRRIVIANESETREYLVRFGKHVIVFEGDEVKAGDPLTEGDINPHDLLAVKGSTVVQEYLVNQIQEVYRLQGVSINDKHMEIIVRKMLRKVKIDEVGDTRFLPRELVDRHAYRDENRAIIEEGGRPATAHPILQGITKASLSTESFLSASSFQDTTRVLAHAAVSGRRDFLRGLKENVLVGRLIPAGTGLHSDDIYDVGKDIEQIAQHPAETAEEEEAVEETTGSALEFEDYEGPGDDGSGDEDAETAEEADTDEGEAEERESPADQDEDEEVFAAEDAQADGEEEEATQRAAEAAEAAEDD